MGVNHSPHSSPHNNIVDAIQMKLWQSHCLRFVFVCVCTTGSKYDHGAGPKAVLGHVSQRGLRSVWALTGRSLTVLDLLCSLSVCVCAPLSLRSELQWKVSPASPLRHACASSKPPFIFFFLSFFIPFFCVIVSVASSSPLLSDAFCLKVHHV